MTPPNFGAVVAAAPPVPVPAELATLAAVAAVPELVEVVVVAPAAPLPAGLVTLYPEELAVPFVVPLSPVLARAGVNLDTIVGSKDELVLKVKGGANSRSLNRYVRLIHVV